MNRFTISIHAKTEFIHQDGLVDPPDISFNKEIKIENQLISNELYNDLFNSLHNNLVSTFSPEEHKSS